MHMNIVSLRVTTPKLREKCPNTELFLVRIFLYSDLIRRFNLRIQSKYRKIRTRNYSVFGHFSRSTTLCFLGGHINFTNLYLCMT